MVQQHVSYEMISIIMTCVLFSGVRVKD